MADDFNPLEFQNNLPAVQDTLPPVINPDSLPRGVNYVLFRDSSGRDVPILIRGHEHATSQYDHIRLMFGEGQRFDLSEEEVKRVVALLNDPSVQIALLNDQIEELTLLIFLEKYDLDVLAIEFSKEEMAKLNVNPRQRLNEIIELFRKYKYKNAENLAAKVFKAIYGPDMYIFATHPKLIDAELIPVESKDFRILSFLVLSIHLKVKRRLEILMKDEDPVRVRKGMVALDTLLHKIFVNGPMKPDTLNRELRVIDALLPYIDNSKIVYDARGMGMIMGTGESSTIALWDAVTRWNEFIGLAMQRDTFMAQTIRSIAETGKSVWLHVGDRHAAPVKSLLEFYSHPRPAVIPLVMSPNTLPVTEKILQLGVRIGTKDIPYLDFVRTFVNLDDVIALRGQRNPETNAVYVHDTSYLRRNGDKIWDYTKYPRYMWAQQTYVVQAQHKLRSLGYRVKINGKLDKLTRDALKKEFAKRQPKSPSLSIASADFFRSKFIGRTSDGRPRNFDHRKRDRAMLFKELMIMAAFSLLSAVASGQEIVPDQAPDTIQITALQQTDLMTVPEPLAVSDNVGGINLNAKLLDLQIKRDEKGIPLPFEQQDLERLKDVKGFLPIIINIQPIQSLPKLLGLDQIPSDENTPEIAAQLSLKAVRMEVFIV